MPRPSRQTDLKLIRAARELLPQCGASGLNLRAVARRAGVNLGMFHYHFGSKEAFIRRVLTDSYEEFFTTLTEQCVGCHADDPLKALEEAALCMGRFARDNRALLHALARDVLSGDRATVAFVRRNFTGHIGVMLKLLAETMGQGRIARMPLPTAMSFLAGAVAAPSLISEIAVRSAGGRKNRALLDGFFQDVVSDEAIRARVRLAIKALEAPRAAKGRR